MLFRIRTYEIDQLKRATAPALVRLMQEAAMQNVIDLKVSVWDMEKHHLTWVMMRMQLEFKQMPMLGDEIRVHTYPAGFEKFFTYRDFLLYNDNGELMGTASSTWLLMDDRTRQMARIPEFILAYPMPKPEDCLPRPSGKLPAFERVDAEMSFAVQWHDLDFNGHLNNVAYLQWMLESTGVENLDQKRLSKIDINYRQECRMGDVLSAQVQFLENGEYLHRLVRQGDGKDIALGKTTWV